MFNLEANLAKEKFWNGVMIVAGVLLIAAVIWGGVVWQKAGRTSAAETAICKLVKPEFLNLDACGKE